MLSSMTIYLPKCPIFTESYQRTRLHSWIPCREILLCHRLFHLHKVCLESFVLVSLNTANEKSTLILPTMETALKLFKEFCNKNEVWHEKLNWNWIVVGTLIYYLSWIPGSLIASLTHIATRCENVTFLFVKYFPDCVLTTFYLNLNTKYCKKEMQISRWFLQFIANS